MEQRASLIREILAEYIRHRADREIMDKYLTDYDSRDGSYRRY